MEGERKRKRAVEKREAVLTVADDQTNRKGSAATKEEVTTAPPPSEEEVEEFFAILRRMKVAVKYFQKGANRNGDGGAGRNPKAAEDVGGKRVAVEENGGAKLDLNAIPAAEGI